MIDCGISSIKFSAIDHETVIRGSVERITDEELMIARETLVVLR